MIHRVARRMLVLALFAPIGAIPLRAQSAAKPPVADATAALRAEIVRADSAMFAAYNANDAERLGRYFAPDLEFFHDTGGLATWAQTMAGFKGVFAQNPGIRRTLVGEVEVYPIKDYGAIEIGAHRFCHVENGRDECGTFRFTHVWRRSGSGWQVSRVVSYGH